MATITDYTVDAAGRSVPIHLTPEAAAARAAEQATRRPPTPQDVERERERRLALGLNYDFGDGRGIHRIGTTPADMRKWMDEVTPIAQALLNLGQPEGAIDISTETGLVTVTAAEWQQILLAAGLGRQPIYQVGFALARMDPIPADYADDRHWGA